MTIQPLSFGVLGLSKDAKSTNFIIDDLDDGLSASRSGLIDTHDNITSLDTGTPLPSRSLLNGSGSLNYDHEQEAAQEQTGKHKDSSSDHASQDEMRSKNTTPSLRLIGESNDQKLSNSDEKPANSEETRKLVKEYFHDLLVYMNKNDATLGEDRDGDLAFFIEQMPASELDMTFTHWVDEKLKTMKQEFKEECGAKLSFLKKDFEQACNSINSLDDDEALLKIAASLELS